MYSPVYIKKGTWQFIVIIFPNPKIEEKTAKCNKPSQSNSKTRKRITFCCIIIYGPLKSY